jgi:hypothetical protein
VKSQEERKIWKRTQREVMNQRGEENFETSTEVIKEERKERKETRSTRDERKGNTKKRRGTPNTL